MFTIRRHADFDKCLYGLRGDVVILMLGGGDKSTQSRDIKAAKELAKTLEN